MNEEKSKIFQVKNIPLPLWNDFLVLCTRERPELRARLGEGMIELMRQAVERGYIWESLAPIPVNVEDKLPAITRKIKLD